MDNSQDKKPATTDAHTGSGGQATDEIDWADDYLRDLWEVAAKAVTNVDPAYCMTPGGVKAAVRAVLGAMGAPRGTEAPRSEARDLESLTNIIDWLRLREPSVVTSSTEIAKAALAYVGGELARVRRELATAEAALVASAKATSERLEKAETTVDSQADQLAALKADLAASRTERDSARDELGKVLGLRAVDFAHGETVRIAEMKAAEHAMYSTILEKNTERAMKEGCQKQLRDIADALGPTDGKLDDEDEDNSTSARIIRYLEGLRQQLAEARKPVQRLDEVAALQDNWDSYGGKAPTAEAVATARQILQSTAAPVSGGGVQLDWDNGDCDIEIGADGKIIVEPAEPLSDKEILAVIASWFNLVRPPGMSNHEHLVKVAAEAQRQKGASLDVPTTEFVRAVRAAVRESTALDELDKRVRAAIEMLDKAQVRT
jgi:hypothetical protein